MFVLCVCGGLLFVFFVRNYCVCKCCCILSVSLVWFVIFVCLCIVVVFVCFVCILLVLFIFFSFFSFFSLFFILLFYFCWWVGAIVVFWFRCFLNTMIVYALLVIVLVSMYRELKLISQYFFFLRALINKYRNTCTNVNGNLRHYKQ